MNFSFENPQKKHEKKKSKFEFAMKFFGIDLGVRVEDNDQPLSLSADLERKKFNLSLTSQDIEKGVNFLKSEKGHHAMQGIANTLSGWNEKLEKLRRDRLAGGVSEKVRDYAEASGKTEADALREILEEIQKESNI